MPDISNIDAMYKIARFIGKKPLFAAETDHY
jgi:hypothetical protein